MTPRIDTSLQPTPILQTSLPASHQDYPARIEALKEYAFVLWQALLAQAPAFVPTVEGPYLDVFRDDDNFTSAVRSNASPPFTMGTATAENYAARVWNLVSKLAEHDGALFAVVAPTASTNERDLLRTTLDQVHDDQANHNDTRDTPSTFPKAMVLYTWLRDPEEFPDHSDMPVITPHAAFDPSIQPMLPL